MKPLPKFIVVVHAKNMEQAVRDSEMARDAGAGGIFLINHQVSSVVLLKIYSEVRRKLEDFFIGLNFLDLTAIGAVNELPINADALWVDNPCIHSIYDYTGNAWEVFKRAAISREGEKWRMFSSVAFKYQEFEPDPDHPAILSSRMYSVTVTSGEGTGVAADLDKIIRMKKAIGDKPLALASGVTAANIRGYLPYIDCFMVATGVSDENDNLVAEKIKELAAIIKSH